MSTEASEVGNDAADETAATPATKTVIEKVTMTDGRVVDFAGKRKLVKEGFAGEAGDLSIRLDFRNGETRSIQLPAALISQFALHGALQKYGDETAGETDVDDMVLGIDKLDKRVQAGEWTVKREGGGMSGTSVLIKALVEYSSKTIEQVKAFLEDKSQAFKIALRNDDKRQNAAGVTVKDIVTRLEAEKVSKSPAVDTDALLAGLDSMG
jgi:hypothetical protein